MSARRSGPSWRSSPQDPKPALLVFGGWGLERGVEVALEHVRPQAVLLGRQALQLEPATRTEVIVRDELVRQVRRFLLLRARERLRADDLVLVLDLLVREHRVDERRLEVVGERLRFALRASALDHRLPRRQVLIERRRLLEEAQPSIEQLVVELFRLDDATLVLLRLAHDLPRGLHVLRGLEGERLAELLGLMLEVLVEEVLLLLDFLFLRLVLVGDRLRRERVLVILRVQEHA